MYVLKNKGSKETKFLMLIATYIAVPLLVLYYLGVLNKLANSVGGIIISAFIVMLMFFYYVALKLNIIKLEDIIGTISPNNVF